MKNFDPNKAHGHVMGSMQIPPLEFALKSFLQSGTFSSEMKKGIVFQVHKKGNKQSLKNYCHL